LLGGELPEATPQPAERIGSDAELRAASARIPVALSAFIARCRAGESELCFRDVGQALSALDSCAVVG